MLYEACSAQYSLSFRDKPLTKKIHVAHTHVYVRKCAIKEWENDKKSLRWEYKRKILIKEIVKFHSRRGLNLLK